MAKTYPSRRHQHIHCELVYRCRLLTNPRNVDTIIVTITQVIFYRDIGDDETTTTMPEEYYGLIFFTKKNFVVCSM